MVALACCALGVGAIISIIFSVIRTKGDCVKSLMLKIVSGLLFLLTAIFAVMANSGVYAYGLLIIMGGVCGLAGDIVLDLRRMYSVDAFAYQISGFIFFMIGHVFYNIAFIYQNKMGWLPVVICAAIGVLISVGNSLISKAKLSTRIIMLVYVVLLTMTCCTAIYAAFTSKTAGMVMAAIGGVLFLASDAILGRSLFGKGFGSRAWRIFINVSYYVAQFLIVGSILFI